MINAYLPIMAVNSYKTHKDYYRVSAVRGVSGGNSTTIKGSLNMPYEGLPYKQFAQKAAQGVAGFIQSAQVVKQSAQSLVNTRLPALSAFTASYLEETDSETVKEPIRQFVDTYNAFQHSLSNSPEYLNRSLLNGLEQAAKPYSLQELGITQLDDGTLELNEEELEQQINHSAGSLRKSLGSITSFAASLANSLGQLQELPAESLFQLSSSELKPYGQYRAKLQAYLPVPMSGLLLDAQM